MTKKKQSRITNHKKSKKHQRNTTVQQSKQNRTIALSPTVMYLIVFAFAFALYANTLNHEYVLDDAIAITENDFVKNGISGIPDILTFNSNTSMFGKSTNLNVYGRYRPLSYITFAVEYEFFGENPFINHLVNVLLYAATAIFLLVIILHLTKHLKLPYNIPVSFAALAIVLIYIAHPVHTEVVANIKSRDEILAFLGMLATLWFTIKYTETKRWIYLPVILLMFLLGLMSKENTLTFIVVVPLTIYFFSNHSLKKTIYPAVSMAIATIIFFAIRSAVTGVADEAATKRFTSEILNNPFVGLSFTEKYLTIFTFMLEYLRLLIFPHPLTIDYYPYQIPIAKSTDYQPYLSMLLYLSIAVLGILTFRRKQLISYAVWFFLLTFSVYSNLFVQLGIFVNERFLYVPLLGFAIFFVAILFQHLPEWLKNRKLSIYIIGVALFVPLILYSAKTINRNKAWKSNYTLFKTDVETSANSAFSNFHYGAMLLSDAQKTENNKPKQDSLFLMAIKYLSEAVEIHPKYKKALFMLGNAHCEYNQNFDTALVYYRRLVAMNSYKEKIFGNLVAYLDKYKNNAKKIEIYNEFYPINPDNFHINYGLGLAYYTSGNYKAAQKHLEKAYSIDNQHADAINNLATVYYVLKKYEKSLEFFKLAVKLKPQNPQYYRNMALAYTVLGEKQKAAECIKQATMIEQK